MEMEVGEISSDKSDAEYGAMIGRAKEHFLAGEVYQIVLSRTFSAESREIRFNFIALFGRRALPLFFSSSI